MSAPPAASVPDLLSIAREMLAVQDGVRQVSPLTARYPGFDLPRAYEVARLMHAQRLAVGAKPLGRKIGFTNPVLWDEYGVREPIWAHVYDTTVRQVEAGAARCSLDGLAEPRIEPEVIVHLAADLKPGDGIDELLGKVDWIAHGFEIVQSHYPAWKFKAADTVADSSLHGRLIVGPRVELQRIANPAAALESFSLALIRDGAQVEAGRGHSVLGSPLRAVLHLLEVLAGQRAEPLRAGELITTGTVTRALPIRRGESWSTQLEGIGLPGLRIDFE